MVSIKVNKFWYTQILLPSLSDWRAGTTREKIRCIILDMLRQQQAEGYTHKGYKNLQNKECIFVSDALLTIIFRDVKSRAKFRRWVCERNIVIKDRSWISVPLAKHISTDPRCDSWHITECDQTTKRSITVEYDPDLGVVGVIEKKIRRAEGEKVNVAGKCSTLVFQGEWAIEEFKQGKMTFSELKQVAKCANLCSKPGKVVDNRVYDAISMSAKRLRSKCIVDVTARCQLSEAMDFNACAIHGGLLGGIESFRRDPRLQGYGLLNKQDSGGILRWCRDMLTGKERDFYEMIWEEVRKEDPRAYPAVFKNARKTIKLDVVCVQNYGLNELAGTRMAYLMSFKGHKVQRNAQRQWLVWKALKKLDKTLWGTLLSAKMNGSPKSFFGLYTLGERILIKNIMDTLESMSIPVYRVHDAIWSADERLLLPDQPKEVQERWSQWLSGAILLEKFGIDISKFKNKLTYTKDEIDEIDSLIEEKCNSCDAIDSIFKDVPQDVLEAASGGLVLKNEHDKEIVRNALDNDDDYGVAAFPKYIPDCYWMYGKSSERPKKHKA